MRKDISLFLLLSMLLPSLLILTACNDGEEPPQGPPVNPPEDKAPALYLPTPGSFAGHATEKFDNFVYDPQSTEELLAVLSAAAEKILAEDTDYALALAATESAEKKFSTYMEMLAYAQICYSKNQEDTFFAAEYKKLYEASPKICFAMERLFCAVAASKHGEALAKTDYYAEDIVSRYDGGGVYTEQTLPLFEEELRILLEIEALSEDSVTITFNNKTDTVTNILNEFANMYGKNSATYQQIAMRCQIAYAKEVNKKRAEFYLSLLSARRAIADALGLESYADLAVQKIGYEANKQDIAATLAAVEAYILPVFRELSASGYFTASTGKVEKIRYPEAMLNTLTAFYESKGGKLFEGYNYLLNKGLFSLGEAASPRVLRSYSVFLRNRLQPFLFISAEGTAADYLSVAYALGDALYYYQNGKENTAFSTEMRTPEFSSMLGETLALLTLEGMEEPLSKTESAMEISTYLVLLKKEIYTLLQKVLTQSMRAAIELELYALEGDEINQATVNAIVESAAERFGCFEMQNGNVTNLTLSTEGLLSHDMFHVPMRSFSDLCSAYVTLSVFLAEKKTKGAGFAAFETILSEDLREGSFASVLTAISLPHPAEEQTIRALATELYEALTGYSYGSNTSAPPSLT